MPSTATRIHLRSWVRSGRPAALVLGIIVLAVEPVRGEPAPFMQNGEPFFPIGLWSYPPGGDFDTSRAEIANAGFNVVHRWYSLVTTSALDADHAYGIKDICWAYAWLGNVGLYGPAIEAKISAIKDHPAFFAWDTRDEPYLNYTGNPSGCGYTREGLTAGKEFVNARDPAHPVMCNFAPYDLVAGIGDPPMTFEGFQLWTSVGNVFGTDRYPANGNYPNTDLNPVDYCCDQLQAIAGEGVPVYVILQGCGMGEWNDIPNPSSRPNLIEDRFMAYTSIIHGIKGILYYGQNHIEPDSQMWADLKTVAGELSSIQDVLCRGITTTDYTIGDTNCEAISKACGGYRYLIVANRTSTTRNTVPISIDGWHSPPVEVLFEGRNLTATLGSFSDHFVPWDSHVYRMPLQTAYVDLGAVDNEHLLAHVHDGIAGGNTEPATIGGRDARKNTSATADRHFYFSVSDAFAFQASRPSLYLTVEYYDAGSGVLTLEYDSQGTGASAFYKAAGSVMLGGTNEWKQHMFHVTDACLGNRQEGGADFRVGRSDDGLFYLDVVGACTESPVPGQAQKEQPHDGLQSVSRLTDLGWSPGERATAYHVYFGDTDPPAFQGTFTGTTFDPGTLQFTHTYYWRVDSVNGFGTTTGLTWTFRTEAAPGDFDADSDLDQSDFGFLQNCLSGSGRSCSLGCWAADLDHDGDVDADDAHAFRECMAGANTPPACTW